MTTADWVTADQKWMWSDVAIQTESSDYRVWTPSAVSDWATTAPTRSTGRRRTTSAATAHHISTMTASVIHSPCQLLWSRLAF